MQLVHHQKMKVDDDDDIYYSKFVNAIRPNTTKIDYTYPLMVSYLSLELDVSGKCYLKSMVLVPHATEDFRNGENQIYLINYGQDCYKYTI